MAVTRRLPILLLLAAVIALPAGAQTSRLPAEMPAPEPRSVRQEDDRRPASMVLPDEEVACRARLKARGARFTPLPRIADDGGCGLDHPIELSRLTAQVDLEPEAVINCAAAEAAATLMDDVASRAAEEAFAASLARVRHVSAYVCRPRADTGRLSEHATGNALDIAGFTLDDETEIVVRPYGRSHVRRAAFLEAVRDGACGIFTTVLGPGTDTDHIDHLHLDLAHRRNGGTWCR